MGGLKVGWGGERDVARVKIEGGWSGGGPESGSGRARLKKGLEDTSGSNGKPPEGKLVGGTKEIAFDREEANFLKPLKGLGLEEGRTGKPTTCEICSLENVEDPLTT